MDEGRTKAQQARQDARQMVVAAFIVGAVVPLLFWVQFGNINGFAWATAGFLAMVCLLSAVGLVFHPLQQYHTPVPLHGGWGDLIGSFWLVSCVFGPLIGWGLTELMPITASSWQSLYGQRVLLAAGLPLITVIPLFRYLRGRAILVGLPVLLIVTFLAVWSAADVAYDLWQGPVVQLIPGTDEWELWLPYTGQSLGVEP
jgi:hypothetical protein